MCDQYLMSKTELKLTLSCLTLSREQFGEIQMTRDFQIQKNKTKNKQSYRSEIQKPSIKAKLCTNW